MGSGWDKMVRVFFDTEFAHAGQNTTLISAGFVSELGGDLYLEFDDYDPTQITPWLRENVLHLLKGDHKVSTLKACSILEDWFLRVAGNQKIQLISFGKDIDNILLFNIWGRVEPGNTLRRWQGLLPACIDHRFHLDLDTICTLHGLNPEDHHRFASPLREGNPHDALFDAYSAQSCWNKLAKGGAFLQLSEKVG